MIKNICEQTGISRRHWNYLLNADRNATPDLAKKLERVIGIERGLWVFGTAKQRQAAWDKAKKKMGRDAKRANNNR